MTVLDQAARLRELVLRHGFGSLSARVIRPVNPEEACAEHEVGALPDAAPDQESAHEASLPLEPEDAPTEVAPSKPEELNTVDLPSVEAECSSAQVMPVEVSSAGLTQALLAKMRPAKAARVVAVASGKGGVGKSHLSCNLAIAAARAGVNTVLVDGDLGMANVDVLLGIGSRRHLGEVMDGSVPLEDVVVHHAQALRVVPGASALAELSDLSASELQNCAQALASLEQDAQLLLLDLGAGAGKSVLAFAAAADELLVITTPEPTAIADAYGLVKVVGAKLPQLRLQLVVNQAESEAEAKSVALRIQSVADRFLPELNLHYLGWVPKDPSVGRAVHAQRAFLEAQPFSPASRAVLQLSAALLGRPLHQPSGGLVARLLNRWGRGA